MRISQLRDLVAVVDHGSIRGAARVLGVAPPALSRNIRQLEEELNVQLLQRLARGVVPTARGKGFLARARIVQNEIARARDELSQSGDEATGSVFFGVSASSGILLVPTALARFQQERPNTMIRIQEGLPQQLMPLLRDGTLDFILGPRVHGHNDPDIRILPVHRNDFVVVARRGHPLRNAKALFDLAQARWVIFAQAGLPGSIIPELFEGSGLSAPKSVVHCESYTTMLALLAGTDMLGVVTRWLLDLPHVNIVLEPLKLKERIPANTVSLFFKADSPLTPAAAAMVAAVKTTGRQLARTDRNSGSLRHIA